MCGSTWSFEQCGRSCASSCIWRADLGCSELPETDDPEEGSYEGVDYDAENPNGALFDDKSDAPRYAIPSDLPQLVSPEVSLPFLRLTARSSDGANTYALHGPITAQLTRGYVSHGCVRMRGDDVIRVFWMAKQHPSMPVTIQKEVELDAQGHKVDVGRTPALWAADATITYGASVGPR